MNRESNTGDICHYDIGNLSNRESRNIFRNYATNDDLFICNNDNEEPFSIEKLNNLIN